MRQALACLCSADFPGGILHTENAGAELADPASDGGFVETTPGRVEPDRLPYLDSPAEMPNGLPIFH